MKTILFLFSLLFTISITAQQLKVGQKVEVRDSGHWYKSTILKVDGDRYRIHYEGYPASDDVWILRSYIRTLEGNGQPTQGNCNFSAPSGNYNDASKASEGLFKKEIYDYYYLRVRKDGVTSPTAIGVTFRSFKMGSSYKNIIIKDWAGHPARKHDGAPLDTMIYSAKADYVICERFASGDSETPMSSTFTFFKNRDGQWVCSRNP